ncbi:hypothetical protein [Chryseobacterium sp. JM1]|uniref:hypothetical protein n=1 Tax=Chryseobacterium sp. JM1 TaxID=1233950 RepID=UPI0004E6A466|nr:hypothetical protein [Chryseobacterium sp. JM1]KFF22186.1 hypothetical protein IW22_03050 [Chryseobacterium sp. JM1]
MKTNSTTAKIKVLLLALLLVFGQFYSQIQNGSVGINTSSPNVNSVLDVVSGNNNKGILIPRLTENQRNAIIINKPKDDGLTIYNTTEDCFNYWSFADDEWKSVCGQMGKAVFTVDCSNTKVMGTYVKGRDLTTSNYLNISVNVTKIGNYTISGTTINGYNFYGTGTFLNTGVQTIQIGGQGTPQNVQTDDVTLTANGNDVTCTPAVSVNVLSPAGSYTMSCGGAVANGVYKVGTALNSSNTITLPINVSSLGSYTITTNTVDGISFRGSGTFTSTGNQNITLSGMGTPSSTAVKTITITSDSQGGVSTTCNVSVIVVIPAKKLLAIGLGTTYGYNLSNSGRPSNTLITTNTNYGTLPASTVKYEGWSQIIDGGNSPSAAQLNTWLLGSAPVDMVVIGYSYGMSAGEASVFLQYLQKGGVILSFCEDTTGNQNFFRTIFNDPSITQSTTGGSGDGRTYTLPITSDEITNGPFGDIRGKLWGDDATDVVYFTGLPSGEISVYSNATNANNSTGTVAGAVTAFKHKSFNLIWVGEGGFNSQSGNTGDLNSNTICPFILDTNKKPTPKTTYGTAGTLIYNSTFTANAFAWAIKQAEFKGINTQ